MKLIFPIILLLTGCASMPKEEALYQVVSAADFSLTINTARRPECFKETGFPTAGIIGQHPSEEQVEGWWAAQAIGHALISRWLKQQAQRSDDDGWRHIYHGWQALTIGYAGYNAAHNYRIGLRPFGAQRSKACEEALRP